jgi:hypothetical protein
MHPIVHASRIVMIITHGALKGIVLDPISVQKEKIKDDCFCQNVVHGR